MDYTKKYINSENVFLKSNIKTAYFLSVILLLYNYNSAINFLIIATIAFIIILLPLEQAIIIYLFLTPWEFLITLPMIGTLTTLVAVLVLLKLLMRIFKSSSCGFTRLNILCLLIIFIYSIINLIIYKSMASFGILTDLVIIIYIYKIKSKKYNEFWETIFNIYIISCVFACLHGVLYNNFADRWVSGLGYVKQFYGTVGTSRMAIFINIAILFTLILDYSKIKKIILLAFLYIMLFLSLSIAGLGINIFIIVLYVFVLSPKISSNLHKQKSISRYFGTIIIFILFLISLYLLKDRISIIQSIFTRAENIVNDLLIGETDRALSGRESIFNTYIYAFSKLNIFNKIFGLGCFSPYSALGFLRYSHNTYIDLLFLGGFFLFFLFILSLFYLLYKQRNKKYFHVILLLKLIILINGLNVSMLTAGFWYIWLFI